MKRTIPILLCLTLSVFSSFAATAPQSDTTGRKMTVKTKKQLVRENEELRKQINGLREELDAFKTADTDTTDILLEEMEIREGVFDGLLNPDEYSAEATDSLLSIWYIHRQIRSSDEGEGYNLDSIRLASSVPDSVIIARLEKINSFISLPYNETVRNNIVLYSEKMPTKMSNIMALATYYLPIFEETFNKYNMPEELKYMAVIESALNPVAVSRANAKGMWQFMYPTAKNYGLQIDSYVDERFDPFKSAEAAAMYLQDAYRIFGDWSLAISSYNCGSGNVNKAIKRSGGKRDFWAIYPYLPKETRGYVPAMVGAMYAMTYYKECGIEPAPVHMPAKVDTFHVNKNLHFRQISDVIGIPISELRNLNPQYFNDIIPGNSGDYILRLPYKFSSYFVDAQDSIYRYKADEVFSRIDVSKTGGGRTARGGSPASSGSGTFITYTVKSGDSLGKIAAKYHVTVSQIQSWNNIKGTTIRVGQKLRIQQKGGSPAAASSQGRSQSSGGSKPATSSGTSGTSGYTVYTVKQGDSLYQIAKKYPGVSAQDIMSFNRIGESIQPGMTLKIPKK